MTVNHGVVGSSPTGGARKKGIAYAVPFFLAPSLGLTNAPSPRLRGLWVRSPATSVSSRERERESLGLSFVDWRKSCRHEINYVKEKSQCEHTGSKGHITRVMWLNK